MSWRCHSFWPCRFPGCTKKYVLREAVRALGSLARFPTPCSGQTLRTFQQHPGSVVGGLGVGSKRSPEGNPTGMASFTMKGPSDLETAPVCPSKCLLPCCKSLPWLQKPCVTHVTQLHHDQRKVLKYSSDGKVLSSVVCFAGSLLFGSLLSKVSSGC